jgi:hypothetical protein
MTDTLTIKIGNTARLSGAVIGQFSVASRRLPQTPDVFLTLVFPPILQWPIQLPNPISLLGHI